MKLVDNLSVVFSESIPTHEQTILIDMLEMQLQKYKEGICGQLDHFHDCYCHDKNPNPCSFVVYKSHNFQDIQFFFESKGWDIHEKWYINTAKMSTFPNEKLIELSLGYHGKSPRCHISVFFEEDKDGIGSVSFSYHLEESILCGFGDC